MLPFLRMTEMTNTTYVGAKPCYVVEDMIWSERQAPAFPLATMWFPPYIDCALCQPWTSEGHLHPLIHLRTVLLHNVARKYAATSCTVCYMHSSYIISNGKQKPIHSSQKLNFCGCQRGSCACLPERAQGYGSSVCGAQPGSETHSHRYIHGSGRKVKDFREVSSQAQSHCSSPWICANLSTPK